LAAGIHIYEVGHMTDERVIEDFWDRYGAGLVGYMDAIHHIEPGDIISIIEDIMERCEEIPAAIGTSIKSADFWIDLAVVMFDLIAAEQRLIAARTGRMPGQLIDDTWPPTPIAFDHPFLAAIQCVVNQIEAEANKGKYKRRAN
jgi:hypothetical protein